METESPGKDGESFTIRFGEDQPEWIIGEDVKIIDTPIRENEYMKYTIEPISERAIEYFKKFVKECSLSNEE